MGRLQHPSLRLSKAKIKSLLVEIITAVASLQGGGGGGGAGGTVPPLTTACSPYFGSFKILFLEHHVTARQQPMIEKVIIRFKHNSPLKFSRFFAKLLATNQWRI